MTNNKTFFENLDSIRFIAACMVFFQHGFFSSYQYLHIENTFLEKILYLISDGETGVSIFFVLSGFLITYLLITEYELNSKITISKFYIRRVLRIWPLYFAVIFFSFIVFSGFIKLIGINYPFGSNILYQISFLSNFDAINVAKHCSDINVMSQGITWSVSIEEQFYVFWPLIFAFLPRKYWIHIIIIIILGSITFRIIHHDDWLVLYYNTFSVLLDLGIGGLFACLIKKYDKVKDFFEKTSTKTHFAFFSISFFLLLFHESLFDFKYGNALSRIFISTSFVLIISSQALTKSISILNLKNLSFASRWGKYTYGIYLIHPIVLTTILFLVKTMHLVKDNFVIRFSIGLTGFILTLIVSKLSYIYFESKFLKLKDKFTIIKSHD